MTEEVFDLSAKKLIGYTDSGDYINGLRKSAEKIAELFKDSDCVLYLNERDADKADGLKSLFGGKTDVQYDRTIRIGGIKAYCESMGIIADETLDSKLEAQREWFRENAALNVL